jgi:hypothetical protein
MDGKQTNQLGLVEKVATFLTYYEDNLLLSNVVAVTCILVKLT